MDSSTNIDEYINNIKEVLTTYNSLYIPIDIQLFIHTD